MPLRKVLALDCSFARTGWATNAGGRVEFGAQSFPVKRGCAPAIRFIDFEHWLERLLLQFPGVEEIVYEIPHHRGAAATQALVGIMAIVQKVATAHSIPYRGVRTQELKIAITGNGSATKAYMQAMAEDTFSGAGYRAAEDEGGDIADALGLLRVGLNLDLSPRVDRPQTRKERGLPGKPRRRKAGAK